MWCQHNDVDLTVRIIHTDDVDWASAFCKECDTYLGERRRLIDMLDNAIKDKRDRVEKINELLDPDFED